MTVTLGQYGGDASTGFTDFGDLVALSYSIYYVSTSGNDGTATVNDPTKPWQTLAAVFSAAGLNSSGTGAIAVLLKMGDTWTGENFSSDGTVSLLKSGISGSFNGTKWSDSTTYSGKPIIFGSWDPDLGSISTYGVNPRQSSKAHPLVKPNNFQFILAGSGGGDIIAFVGIDVYNTLKDPTHADYNSFFDGGGNSNFSFNVAHTFWLMEDCYSGYSGGVGIAFGSSASSNQIIRRSKIQGAWVNGAGHTSGHQTNAVTSPVNEENVFDMNGWNETKNQPDNADRTQNHDFYYNEDCADVTVRGTIVMRGCGSEPIRPPNCTIFDNFFTDCQSNQHDLGQGSTVQDNVYSRALTMTSTIDPGSAVEGRGINIPARLTDSAGQISYTRNIWSNIQSGGDMALAHGDGSSASFNQNIIYLWGDNASTSGLGNLLGLDDDVSPSAAPFGGGALTFNNIIQTITGTPGTYDNVTSTTSGSGQRLRLTVVVDGGGNVSSVTPYQNPAGNQHRYPGQKYAVNDTVTPTPGECGGATFTCKVATVSGAFTFGTNWQFMDGAWTATSPYSWQTSAPPGFITGARTALTYSSEILGGSATLASFRSAVLANVRQNWSNTKTAPAVNNYIRAGFGIGSTSTTQSPTTSVRGNSKHKKQFFYH